MVKKSKKPTDEKTLETGKPPNHRESTQRPLMVVGIGASAGGFGATKRLLSQVSAEANLALILIQHLKAEFESNLPVLLEKSTDLQIQMAENDMEIEAGRLYILPPGQLMKLDGYRIVLTPREQGPGKFRPIDRFFESLGLELGEAALAVVLSGSGCDGTAGIRTVKAEGGIVLAQDESSAEFSEMPHHAVESGFVDQVLPPEEIGLKLMELCRHSELLKWPPRGTEREPTPEPIVRILQDLQKIGVDFSHYKQSTVQRRIARRMVVHQLPDLGRYADFLQEHPEEVAALKEDLLIKVTSFFRNPEVFEVLRREAFPVMVRDKHKDHPLRLWVPGCATGEEVYSLAMSLSDFLNNKKLQIPVQIFGTDLSDLAIEKARRGIYREAEVGDLSEKQLERYFTKVDNGYQINKTLREMAIFARQDFTCDPPFSRIDLISCRNVLIYFGPELQKKVMPIFHFALRPEGFLLLGSSENIGRFEEFFTPVDKKHRIYTRKTVRERFSQYLTVPSRPATERSLPTPEDRTGLPTKEADLVKEADRILLRKYNPAAVVVNPHMDILHFRGDTSPYLEHFPGKASLNLVKMARDPLRMELRTLLHKAMKEHKPQHKEHIHILCGNASRKIRLDVTPFSASGEEGYFLIQFESESEPEAVKVVPRGKEDAELRKEIDRLKQELSTSFDYTQTLIEEKESAFEELTAANEEILSSNEELQSINEEMETAKEELESTNEELVTVNTELQSRNQELSRAHDDLQNLILSAEIPFVIVDQNLCISRISPHAETALNIRPRDLGRPLNDIRLNFELPQLEKLISQVINEAHSEEREILNKQRLWNLLRIRPYLTAENRIEGAVLSLIDIDRLKRSMEDLEQSYKFALRIVDTIKDPLVVLSSDLRVKTANPSFYETFQVSPIDTEGQLLYELGSGQWSTAELRTLLEKLLPKSAKMDNFLVKFDFPILGQRSMLLSARKIVALYPEGELILLSIEDVTLRLKMEEELRQAKRKAEASSQAKSEFLANMSHEIRTPMTVVQGAVEQLQRTDLNPEQKVLLDMAGTSAQMLMELLGDILDFSMIEAKKINLEFRSFCLREWAEKIIAVLLAEARRKGLELFLEVATEVPATIFADSTRLRQVVVNLVGNALKFTEQGEVKLTIELTADDFNRQMLRFSVSDTGIGIPEDKIDLIFSAFSQADASMTRKYGGTGLGLSICKQLVECMDGEIRVQSKPDKGSIFSFTIPLFRDDKQSDLKTPNETEPSVPLIRNAIDKRRSALIVEDDQNIRHLLEYLLESQGWQVFSTTNGEQALSCLESDTFDLVLTDLQMPGMDGRKLARTIRQREIGTGNHLPIIALTGHAQKIDQKSCLDAGMDDYISKPFSADRLFSAMERLLKKPV